ncbi:MAG: hypothetical protein ABSG43_02110 [Solirubrobacteraceae bacterium]
MSAELLLDNSAWARLDQASLPQDRADEIADLLVQGRIATCVPCLLLVEQSDLQFNSVWLAARGSL